MPVYVLAHNNNTSHVLLVPLPDFQYHFSSCQHPCPSALSLTHITFLKFIQYHEARAWTIVSFPNRRVTRLGFTFAGFIGSR